MLFDVSQRLEQQIQRCQFPLELAHLLTQRLSLLFQLLNPRRNAILPVALELPLDHGEFLFHTRKLLRGTLLPTLSVGQLGLECPQAGVAGGPFPPGAAFANGLVYGLLGCGDPALELSEPGRLLLYGRQLAR